MGGLLCKEMGESPAVIPQIIDNKQYSAELRSYTAACNQDPDLQSFDASLQARTNRVINTVAVGVDARSLSFNSLKEITGGLLDTNQEVVKMILDCKRDIWKNPELFRLVEEYFANSLHMLDFCTALEKCLNRTRNSQFIMRVALQQFEEENSETRDGEKYLRTMEELKKFKDAGDPFTEEFFQILRKVHLGQLSMLQKLQFHKSKINKKLKSAKAWRKVSNVIFVTAFVTIIICSVVAAAVAAPPIAAALAGSASVPVGSVGKWFDSLWKRYQVALEKQGELITSMQVRTLVMISDLDSIRLLIDRLDIQIQSIMQSADFALRGDEAVRFGIEEIKKNMDIFMQSVEDLRQHASQCNEHITKGRTAILQKIIKYSK